MDSGDYNLVSGIRDLQEKTVKELKKSNDLQEKLLVAFNQVVTELRQMRQDHGQMDQLAANVQNILTELQPKTLDKSPPKL